MGFQIKKGAYSLRAGQAEGAVNHGKSVYSGKAVQGIAVFFKKTVDLRGARFCDSSHGPHVREVPAFFRALPGERLFRDEDYLMALRQRFQKGCLVEADDVLPENECHGISRGCV